MSQAPGLRSRHQAFHQEKSSEAASASSQLKAAMEEEVQTNETMEDLNETKDELDRVRKTLARTEEEREMWKILFEDCNKKQEKEIERLRQEYK